MTARGLRVEIAEELVFPGLQRADVHRDLLSTGDHLFAPELSALELLRRRIVVLDSQGDFLAGRDFDFSRLKLVVFDDQRVGGFLRGGAGSYRQNQGEQQDSGTRHIRVFRKLLERANATESHLISGFNRRRKENLDASEVYLLCRRLDSGPAAPARSARAARLPRPPAP